MINYIIQVLLFQTIFLAVYDLILKKETFFQWNRAYLILTSVLAYVIPLIRFTGMNKNIPEEYRIMLPEVILSPEIYIEKNVKHSAALFTGFQWLLITGGLMAALIFVYKIVQLVKLIRTNQKEKKKEYDLVLLPEQQSSFSFFRYIFLGNNLSGKEQIIAHELVHVKQKHSIDLLFFELQKIFLWFNPYSYLYQKRIAELHEFIADAKTVNKKEKSTFYNSLLAETFRVDRMAFVNSYNNQSIIKKRIIMFSKSKSKEIVKLKYLWLLPVLIGMMVYSSCETSTEPENRMSKVNVKRILKFVIGDGEKTERKVIITKKEGYLDVYSLGAKPEGKPISYKDLTDAEKMEFDEDKYFNSDKEYKTFKFFEMEDGTRAVQEIINWKELKKSWKSQKFSESDTIPFAMIDEIPLYPGLEKSKSTKEDFSQQIAVFIKENFDKDLANHLGLESGKKRIYVQFTIDKSGNITNVKSRAPHKRLEEEAVRVISSLPQMKPGIKDGKEVAVKYTLPITLNVE